MSKLIHKKPKRVLTNPLAADPTRTTTLRRVFSQALLTRMSMLSQKLSKVVGDENALGLQLGTPFEVTNTRWAFHSTTEQMKAFMSWFMAEAGDLLYPNDENSWWREYVQAAYLQGAGNTLKKYGAKASRFAREAFNNTVQIERVKVLAARVLSELKNVTHDMATKMQRVLLDGVAQGQSPREVAKHLSDTVEGIGKNRANMIAQTETVRAHASGQLDSLENLGMQNVGVQVEWSTSGLGKTRVIGKGKNKRGGNPSPCKVCRPMKGTVFTIEQARGLIPRHPWCRCSWVPAGVGEDTTGQKLGKGSVSDAISRSIRAEIPPSSKRTLSQQKTRTSWAGADLKINARIYKRVPKGSPNGGEFAPMTSEEKESIHSWSMGTFSGIQQGEKSGADSFLATLAGHFNSALNKLPSHKGVVYRAQSVLKEELDRMVVGSEFIQGHSVSSSRHEGTAKNGFLKDILEKQAENLVPYSKLSSDVKKWVSKANYEKRLKQGALNKMRIPILIHYDQHSGRDISDKVISIAGKEDEVVIRKGSTHLVTKAENRGNYWEIHLKELSTTSNFFTENFNPYRDEKGRYTSKDKAVNWHDPVYFKAVTKTSAKGVKQEGWSDTTQHALHDALRAQLGPEVADRVNLFRLEMNKHNKGLETIRQKVVKDVVKHEKAVAKHKAAFESIASEAEPLFHTNEKKHTQLTRKAVRVFDKLQQAKTDLDLAKADARQVLIDSIGTKDKAHVKMWGMDSLTPVVRGRAEHAMEWYNQVLSRKAASRPDQATHSVDVFPIVPTHADTRSFALRKENGLDHQIHMSEHAGTDVHVHEIGHTIEFSSKKVNDMTRGFISHRVEGQNPEHYGPGKEHEVGFRDEFTKTFHGYEAVYVGKHYNDGSTEVLAMGFQKLFTNPGELANHDPEYFKLLVGVLRGDFHE